MEDQPVGVAPKGIDAELGNLHVQTMQLPFKVRFEASWLLINLAISEATERLRQKSPRRGILMEDYKRLNELNEKKFKYNGKSKFDAPASLSELHTWLVYLWGLPNRTIRLIDDKRMRFYLGRIVGFKPFIGSHEFEIMRKDQKEAIEAALKTEWDILASEFRKVVDAIYITSPSWATASGFTMALLGYQNPEVLARMQTTFMQEE